MRAYRLFSHLHDTGSDRGAVAIITALMLIFVLPGFAALAVDMGRYMSERQQLQHALDAGALAGAQFLPFEGTEAAATARQFALENDPDLQGVSIEVGFGCLVKADSTDPLSPSPTEVSSLCGEEFRAAIFNCPGNGRCYLPCDFNSEGSRCNAISVRAQITVPLILAGLVRGNTLTTLGADLEGNACRGNCGTPPELDLVILIDRSLSLGPNDYPNVQEGAKSVLRSDFVPELHRVALGAIPDLSGQGFIVEGLTDEYERLEGVIDGLQQNGTLTDIGSPITEARDLLQADASANPDRDDVNQYIILLTDGVPNQPIGAPCQHAIDEAAAAKGIGIRVFTIGYRLTPDPCNALDFGGATAAELLQSMASGGDNAGPPDTICALENQDDDDFLCQEAGENLTEIFNQIIQAIFNELEGSSLVDLSAYRL